MKVIIALCNSWCKKNYPAPLYKNVGEKKLHDSIAFVELQHLELLFTRIVVVLCWGHFSQYELVACPMTLYAMYSAHYDVVQMYCDGLDGNSLLEECHHD